jgi:hypothetical protein
MTTFTLQDLTPQKDDTDNEPRSFWNFRLVDMRTVKPTEANDWIEMCEVFYDRNGVPAGYTAANPFGEDVKDVREMLYQMLEATEKSVLTGDDFKGSFDNGYKD